MTLQQLLIQFPDDRASKAYLVQRRWPNGVTCPKCGNVNVWYVTHRPFHWICKRCNENGYRFSVVTKTIFENTKYPLSGWFKVILILSQRKRGPSALQIQRMLGMGSYRTAWYMCRRIRAALNHSALDEPAYLGEAHETALRPPSDERRDGSILGTREHQRRPTSRRSEIFLKPKPERAFLERVRRHAPELLNGAVDFDAVVTHILRPEVPLSRADVERRTLDPACQKQVAAGKW